MCGFIVYDFEFVLDLFDFNITFMILFSILLILVDSQFFVALILFLHLERNFTLSSRNLEIDLFYAFDKIFTFARFALKMFNLVFVV